MPSPVRATNFFVPCGIQARSPIDTTAEQVHRVEIEKPSLTCNERKTGFEPATLTFARWWFASPWGRRFHCSADPSTRFPPCPPTSPL
jgi:hypothetical protein